ncbi:tRNA N(3)-methylcytidine methyltransferase METTL2B [Manis javanica]|nr:tRNA N(3)-methylcytidine methyltransferase METTL2B [Manis javanica]
MYRVWIQCKYRKPLLSNTYRETPAPDITTVSLSQGPQWGFCLLMPVMSSRSLSMLMGKSALKWSWKTQDQRHGELQH